MFNLGGFFGGIGRVLPGYTTGYRSAISDNWNDLNQYNQVQAGQIRNAFEEATFNPRLSMAWDAATNYQAGMHNNLMNLALQRALFPGQYRATEIAGAYMPWQQALAGAMGLQSGWGMSWPYNNQQGKNPMQQNMGGGLPSVAQRR